MSNDQGEVRGAIFGIGGSIVNSTFWTHSAIVTGGAVYEGIDPSSSCPCVPNPTLAISQSSFAGNVAEQSGPLTGIGLPRTGGGAPEFSLRARLWSIEVGIK